MLDGGVGVRILVRGNWKALERIEGFGRSRGLDEASREVTAGGWVLVCDCVWVCVMHV